MEYLSALTAEYVVGKETIVAHSHPSSHNTTENEESIFHLYPNVTQQSLLGDWTNTLPSSLLK